MIDFRNNYYINFCDLDAYELHPMNEKSSTTLLMDARDLHYTYDMSSLLFTSLFVCLC